MRILFCAPFFVHHPAIGPSTNIAKANSLERVGAEVIRYDYRVRRSQVGPEEVAKEVIRCARAQEVDLVLIAKGETLDPLCVTELRRTCAVAIWFPDHVCNYRGIVRAISARCSYVFMGRWSALYPASQVNPRCLFLHECFDPDSNYPLDVPPRYGVSFIGSINSHGEVHSGRKLYCESVDAEVLTGLFGLDHARAASASEINLSFSEGDGTSDRLYKLLATGGFVLTQPFHGLENDFTPGEDIDIFESVEDLRDKVEYYSRNAQLRTRIANRGRHTVARMTNDNWARTILLRCGLVRDVGSQERLGGHVDEYRAVPHQRGPSVKGRLEET